MKKILLSALIFTIHLSSEVLKNVENAEIITAWRLDFSLEEMSILQNAIQVLQRYAELATETQELQALVEPLNSKKREAKRKITSPIGPRV